jgi:hypothetical protein
MFNLKRTAGAIAMGLILVASASPGFARGGMSAQAGQGWNQDWRNARAEAIGGDFGGRAAALRTCNKKSDKYKEYTWGEETDFLYRACMSERGQPE